MHPERVITMTVSQQRTDHQISGVCHHEKVLWSQHENEKNYIFSIYLSLCKTLMGNQPKFSVHHNAHNLIHSANEKSLIYSNCKKCKSLFRVLEVWCCDNDVSITYSKARRRWYIKQKCKIILIILLLSNKGPCSENIFSDIKIQILKVSVLCLEMFV